MIQDEVKDVPRIELNEEDKKQRDRIIKELDYALEQRRQHYTELDDMTYDEYYEANKKAAAAYIPAKRNREEVRTTTGVTRDKSTTLLSSLLDYEFGPDIEAYEDNNLPDVELGDVAEDLVKKSRMLEIPDYDVKRAMIYKELCDQGTAFVLERWVERELPRKEITNMDVSNLNKLKWKEKMETLEAYCDSQLVPGTNIFLGNIREFHIEKQPFIGIRYVRSRPECESQYGEWERWKYVPKKMTHITNEYPGDEYEDWVLIETRDEFIEEMIYFNKFTNEMQILLNGVPMLKAGFPLEWWLGIVDYPIAKGDLEPISPHFAYSRSIPGKTKVNQALMDEMYKLMIVKTRKSYKPPMANNTGTKLSDRIFLPGTITEGVNPEKLQPIGGPMEAQGVTGPEFNMINYVKQLIDGSSVSPVFEGSQLNNKATATEVATLQKQTMMKLGITVVGIINLEKKLAWLRLYNIMKKWTDPIDYRVGETRDGIIEMKPVYRTESVETAIEGGERGQRMVEFTEGVMPEPEQVMAEEDILSERKGVPVRKVYINPHKFRGMKHKFYIEIIPEEKNTSELKKAMRKESALTLMQMFPDMINREFLLKKLAQDSSFDPDKLIMQQQVAAMPQGPEGQTGQMTGQMAQAGAPQPQQPSLNTLIGAAQ